jgi:ice-binding like protein
VVLALPSEAAAANSLDLGTAATYSILAGSTVTNTGLTDVAGDVGVSPGPAITGFPPGVAHGVVHAGDLQAAQAQVDLGAAYNGAASRGGATAVGAALTSATLTPGVYNAAAALDLSGVLTLDALGDADAEFVFQIGTALTTASATQIVTVNGAQACHVYWQVGSSATLGTATSFLGSIMAMQSITLTTGAALEGRALARVAAVTLDTNAITEPDCAASPTVTATVTETVTAAPAAEAVTAPPETETVTQTVTAPPVTETVTQTVSAAPVTVTDTVTGAPVTQTVTAPPATETVTQTVTAPPVTETVTQTVSAAPVTVTDTVTGAPITETVAAPPGTEPGEISVASIAEGGSADTPSGSTTEPSAVPSATSAGSITSASGVQPAGESSSVSTFRGSALNSASADPTDAVPNSASSSHSDALATTGVSPKLRLLLGLGSLLPILGTGLLLAARRSRFRTSVSSLNPPRPHSHR